MMKAKVFGMMVLVALLAQVSFAGLVGQWTFDDPANPGAALEGDPSFTGGVAVLDADDGLNASELGVAGGGARTISAWIKVDSGNYGGAIVSWGDSWNGQLGYRWTFKINNSSGELRAEIGGGYATGTQVVTDGQWHHVAVTTSDSDMANTLFYVDGVLDTTGAYGNDNPINSQAAPISIGYSKAAKDLDTQDWMYLNGSLDDVRVYDEQLSASEVAALVPEPATLSMLGLGIFGLISSRKRK